MRCLRKPLIGLNQALEPGTSGNILDVMLRDKRLEHYYELYISACRSRVRRVLKRSLSPIGLTTATGRGSSIGDGGAEFVWLCYEKVGKTFKCAGTISMTMKSLHKSEVGPVVSDELQNKPLR